MHKFKVIVLLIILPFFNFANSLDTLNLYFCNGLEDCSSLQLDACKNVLNVTSTNSNFSFDYAAVNSISVCSNFYFQNELVNVFIYDSCLLNYDTLNLLLENKYFDQFYNSTVCGINQITQQNNFIDTIKFNFCNSNSECNYYTLDSILANSTKYIIDTISELSIDSIYCNFDTTYSQLFDTLFCVSDTIYNISIDTTYCDSVYVETQLFLNCNSVNVGNYDTTFCFVDTGNFVIVESVLCGIDTIQTINNIDTSYCEIDIVNVINIDSTLCQIDTNVFSIIDSNAYNYSSILITNSSAVFDSTSNELEICVFDTTTINNVDLLLFYNDINLVDTLTFYVEQNIEQNISNSQCADNIYCFDNDYNSNIENFYNCGGICVPCNNCPYDTLLISNYLNKNLIDLKLSNWIKLKDTIENGTDYTFKAGQFVELNDIYIKGNLNFLATIESCNTEEVEVILELGQSNMTAIYGIDLNAIPEDLGVKIFNPIHDTLQFPKFANLVHGVNSDARNAANQRYSQGTIYSNLLQSVTDKQVYLFKFGRGASRLQFHLPTVNNSGFLLEDWNPNSPGELYDQFISNWYEFESTLIQDNKIINIDKVIWNQWESDQNLTTNEYYLLLKNHILNFNNIMGNSATNWVLTLAEIGTTNRVAQLQLCSELSNVSCQETTYIRKPDNLHYNNLGIIQLAYDLFENF